MNRRGDEFGELVDVIAFATRFMKTYQGIVLDDQDELKRGRVRVSIPDLGMNIPSESPWAEPEYPGRGAITPAIGDTVPVYFIAGDVSRPVYRSARMGEIKGSTPPSYTGPIDSVIIDVDGLVMKYDSLTNTLSITAPNIEINGNTRNPVSHVELNTALQTFITALNIALGTKLDGAGTTGALSIDISSAKSNAFKMGD